MKGIRNIVFDLGGVILQQEEKAAYEAFKELGFRPAQRNPLLRLFIMRKLRLRMVEFINGNIPEEEFVQLLRSRCTPDTTELQVKEALCRVAGEIPPSRLKWLEKLKKHYNVYLLSNLNNMLWEVTQHEMKRHGYTPEMCFHQIFLSYRMQLAKPDVRIYKTLIEQTGIIPKETLYFDDVKANIKAGRKIGFNSILVPQNQIEKIIPHILSGMI